jgi:hypothetical protein
MVLPTELCVLRKGIAVLLDCVPSALSRTWIIRFCQMPLLDRQSNVTEKLATGGSIIGNPVSKSASVY